jgi:hypothetical protein
METKQILKGFLAWLFIKSCNEPCIISTYGQPYLEIGLAIWIYFFNQNAGISFDNIIKLLGYKMIGQVSLSDTMKKFFAFLNLNNVSNSGKM